jgi:N-acetylmuramoyl-L-alanine amidase
MNKNWFVIGFIIISLIIITMTRRIKDLRLILPTHPNKRFKTRPLAGVDTIVIHHTAGPANQTARQIAQYHIGPNHVCSDGCPGILYHYVINRFGTIYHVNNLENLVWHAAPMNTRSIGVVLIGNFDRIQPTEAQIDSVKFLVAHLRKRLGSLKAIGHREACNGCKSCPGQNMYTVVESLAQA